MVRMLRRTRSSSVSFEDHFARNLLEGFMGELMALVFDCDCCFWRFLRLISTWVASFDVIELLMLGRLEID